MRFSHRSWRLAPPLALIALLALALPLEAAVQVAQRMEEPDKVTSCTLDAAASETSRPAATKQPNSGIDRSRVAARSRPPIEQPTTPAPKVSQVCPLPLAPDAVSPRDHR